MSDISKINVGGTEYDIKDATARTETQPVSRGGTGATTASGALTNLGAMAAKPAAIELTPKSGTTNGGYIDFHYGGSTADYTTRLIESASGWLTLSGGLQMGESCGIRADKFYLMGRNSGVATHQIWFEGSNNGNHMQMRPNYDTFDFIGTSSYRFHKVYSANGVATSSDRRLKKNITDDFTALTAVFAKLRPVTYEYADMNDGLIRIGFIAQEVESAMAEEGLNAEDYAFLCKEEIDPDSEMAKFIGDTTVYSLNYSEFVALNTAVIQQQQTKIDSLEARLAALEEKIK